ncbi:MAG: peptidoglycan editing factor PgeF [Shewanella sp.]
MLVHDWPVPANVGIAMTDRHGGVSPAPYHSLNLGLHVGDDPQHVQANRERVVKRLQLPSEPVWLEQVHGTEVLDLAKVNLAQLTAPSVPVASVPVASAPISSVPIFSRDNAAVPRDNPILLQAPVADASYTRLAGRVCAVMTADCLPVLLCDRQGQEVAAVHAGWRGLCQGVIEQTVGHFTAPAAQLIAYLGPAIGPVAFEVGPEVRQAFVAQHADAKACFVARGDKYLADITALARLRLTRLGVTQIYSADICTVSNPDYFSYRRDHVTGRMASLIWLKS